jgi:translation initiation factor IF-2
VGGARDRRARVARAVDGLGGMGPVRADPRRTDHDDSGLHRARGPAHAGPDGSCRRAGQRPRGPADRGSPAGARLRRDRRLLGRTAVRRGARALDRGDRGPGRPARPGCRPPGAQAAPRADLRRRVRVPGARRHAGRPRHRLGARHPEGDHDRDPGPPRFRRDTTRRRGRRGRRPGPACGGVPALRGARTRGAGCPRAHTCRGAGRGAPRPPPGGGARRRPPPPGGSPSRSGRWPLGSSTSTNGPTCAGRPEWSDGRWADARDGPGGFWLPWRPGRPYARWAGHKRQPPRSWAADGAGWGPG